MGDTLSKRQWTTKHEIKFIQGLGKHRPEAECNPAKVFDLLVKYIDSIPNRVWEGIDVSLVKYAANKRLTALRVGGGTSE